MSASKPAYEVHLERLPKSVDLMRSGSGGVEFIYLDERLLPCEECFVTTSDWQAVVDAIKTLAVRGAPAIGIAGAAALVLWAYDEGVADAAGHGCSLDAERFAEALRPVAQEVSSARPTAVNLMWAVSRVSALVELLAKEGVPSSGIAERMYEEVRRMEEQDIASNRAIGESGAELLASGSTVLTHCNAGSLGTVLYGTALSVVYSAAEQGKIDRVYADETRPVGQGARLTTWELARVGIPTTLICDNMAASLMAQGKIDAVIVGADRITANGDVANKIGTYGVAVLAKHHGIPFYVAAPWSTIDLSLEKGDQIPIEQRDPSEVLPQPIEGVAVYNPAFDVTPADLITAIITDKGVFAPNELPRQE